MSAQAETAVGPGAQASKAGQSRRQPPPAPEDPFEAALSDCLPDRQRYDLLLEALHRPDHGGRVVFWWVVVAIGSLLGFAVFA